MDNCRNATAHDRAACPRSGVGKAVLFFNAVIGKASVEGPYRNHEADDEEHESDVCEGFAKVEEAQGTAEQGEDGCEATEQL